MATKQGKVARPRASAARLERRGDMSDAVLTVRMPSKLKAAAQKRASASGVDLSEVIRDMLRLYAAGRLELRTVVRVDGHEA